MNLIYKIALPAFLALILVIVWAALSAKRSLTEALSQEIFLRITETVQREAPQYLRSEHFIKSSEASSQKQFRDFADDLKGPSVARLTIWNRDHVIVFSDLKSLIGFHSPDHQDLKRLFSEEKPFSIEREEDVNEPVQSGVGEFIDIYVPVRISGKVVGAVEIHAVITAILTPVQKHLAQLTYVLIPASALILAIVFVVVFRDIREQKQAQEQIQRHLRRISMLHEIDLAITSTLDLRGVLEVLLKKIDVVLPYSATTIRLLNIETGQLEPVACWNLDEKAWKVQEWIAGRGTPNLVFESKAPLVIGDVQSDARCRDPEFFRKHALVSYLGVPLIAKGQVLGVLGFYTKERHEFSDEEVEFLGTLGAQAAIAINNSQLYGEMTKLAADLARSNRVKDEFLSVMSHELRTPLSVVMGYVGMIKDRMLGEINEEQEKALEKVISRAKDQLTLLSGILHVTQLEAERVKVESHETSLGKFLNDLKSTYDVPLEKKLTLTWDYPSDLPTIATDSGKLKQILQNLINNAIKFTEKGCVTISARYVPEAKAVEFKVADTGIGIVKEHLPSIFEKFRQVDSSETRLHGGVGLGLYIVKKFTEMLGGKVEAASAVGKGSTFTVTIPCDIRQSAIDSQSLMVNT